MTQIVEPTLQALLPLSPAALARRMAEGHRLPADQLPLGWYRGTSLGLWAWVERLTWKTFAKTVVRDPEGLRGFNVRLEQDGLGAPPRPRGPRPVVFGHYGVVDAPGGLLIDYGLGGGPRLDPGRLVRDPLVALRPGDPTLLLGRSLLDLGLGWAPTPSFFLLEYVGPLPEAVEAAGRRPALALSSRT